MAAIDGSRIYYTAVCDHNQDGSYTLLINQASAEEHPNAHEVLSQIWSGVQQRARVEFGGVQPRPLSQIAAQVQADYQADQGNCGLLQLILDCIMNILFCRSSNDSTENEDVADLVHRIAASEVSNNDPDSNASPHHLYLIPRLKAIREKLSTTLMQSLPKIIFYNIKHSKLENSDQPEANREPKLENSDQPEANRERLRVESLFDEKRSRLSQVFVSSQPFSYYFSENGECSINFERLSLSECKVIAKDLYWYFTVDRIQRVLSQGAEVSLLFDQFFLYATQLAFQEGNLIEGVEMFCRIKDSTQISPELRSWIFDNPMDLGNAILNTPDTFEKAELFLKVINKLCGSRERSNLSEQELNLFLDIVEKFRKSDFIEIRKIAKTALTSIDEIRRDQLGIGPHSSVFNDQLEESDLIMQRIMKIPEKYSVLDIINCWKNSRLPK
jgi:hypothetical protein